MKIGYPCINKSVGCTANSTFRLASYSEKRLIETIKNNLSCLLRILNYNSENNLLFFRISSDVIPFASHSVNVFDWEKYFKKELVEIGDFIKNKGMRISMHPDQFVLINAQDEKIINKSILDLNWHCKLLDSMGLDESAKVQIHVGGMYGDKDKAINRFIKQYKNLDQANTRRLVIENDDRLFSLQDCLEINKETGVPIIFDNFHHECLNNEESLKEALILASKTWENKDGLLMCDYSSQEPGERRGKHTQSIDIFKFTKFLKDLDGLDFDIMLEIKDKEPSALKAIDIAKNLGRI